MPVDVDAVVVSNVRLSDEYNVIAFRAPEIAAQVEPGQFVMVKPARGLDPLLRRPFSVFERLRGGDGAPAGFSLLNKRVGVGTGLLYQLEPGARAACLGPLGRPFSPAAPPARAWMVAGGVGLAPFATLAESLAGAGVETTLFYGARTRGELFCLEPFDRLRVHVVLATEDGSRGERGRVTVPLERRLRETPASTPLKIYACGPTPMLHAVARMAAAYRRPAEVSLEQVMGCGLGGCYSCVVPVAAETRNSPVRLKPDGHERHYARACIEGPVFASDRVVWEELSPPHHQIARSPNHQITR